LVRVQILDPAEIVQHPHPGWIIDRSRSGLCLTFHRHDVEVGDLLLVKPASRSGLSWVKVKVRNRRRKANRLELGCEFVHARAG
jgi:hypothetical protein